MQSYLQEKAKTKAIALYTFKSIVPANKKEIKTLQAVEALRIALFKYHSNISENQIQQLIESTELHHKDELCYDDFALLFEKAFEFLMESLDHKI